MSNFFSTLMLIPGCALGAGLFSFPVLTGLSGFLPSSIVIFLSWIFSTFIGLLLLEMSCFLYDKASVEQKNKIHFATLNDNFLSKFLNNFYTYILIFISYGSLIGYVSGIVPIVDSYFNIGFFNILAITLLTMIVFMLQKKNFLLMVNNLITPLTILLYIYCVLASMFNFNISTLFAHTDFSKIHLSLPTILASFSFQLMVPSLVTLMKGQKKQLRKVIVFGTGINFLIYLTWNMLILGCVSIDSINHAYEKSYPITMMLGNAGDSIFKLVGNVFAVTTMFTSFLAIGISVKDYWLDSKKISYSSLKSNVLLFLPVIVICYSFSNLFLWIFSSSGGYGDALIFGILPVYMIYKAKQKGLIDPFSNCMKVLSVAFFSLAFFVQFSEDITSLMKLFGLM